MWAGCRAQENGPGNTGSGAGTLGSDQGDAWVTEKSSERCFKLRGRDGPGWVLASTVTPAVCLQESTHVLNWLNVVKR